MSLLERKEEMGLHNGRGNNNIKSCRRCPLETMQIININMNTFCFRLVSCLQVAKFVGLKYGTFYKHYKNTITPQLKKKSLGTGPRSFLGEPLEDEIIKHIDNLWVCGFPLTWWSVKQIA